MLGHILRHHLIVEGKRVLVSEVIVELTSLGFNQKGPTRLRGIVQTILLSAALLLQHYFLVFPS